MTEHVHIDSEILREYDIRGIAETRLTPSVVRVLGQALAGMLSERGCVRVALGYDGRHSSPALEDAMAAGLATGGVAVCRIGCGPSPMLYFAVHHLPTDAGVMITGSHNPPEYNGIKINAAGKPFWGADIQELGRRARALSIVEGAQVSPESITDTPVFDAYVDRLLQDYDTPRFRNGPCASLKIAWDPGNGAAGEVIAALVKRLPGAHIVINGTIDGAFPAHHPDPTQEKNLSQLKACVQRHGCDMGLAFDGDGDRLGVVDARGAVLWGDQVLVILARRVLADNPGATIITDIKASRVFFDEINRLGGNALMWMTGHSLIKNKMLETGSPLAGEVSAHIFIKHRYYGFDDGIYAALRLIEAVIDSGQSLAATRDALPAYINTPEMRFPCADDKKLPTMEKIKHEAVRLYGDDPAYTLLQMDGIRVEGPQGWWLLRSSNTENVLVARCESSHAEGLEQLKACVRALLAHGGIEADL